nr:unnamed protein product [Callosobruchus chinensis]
MAGLSRQSTN